MHIDRIIVAGTDTGIGKTVLSALMMLALDGEYWKPVQSGLEEESDTECVARLTGLPRERFHQEAYRLTHPLSPDQSARLDGVVIERERLALPSCTRPLVIEPAGGLMVPYADDLLQVDCFRWWQAPVLLAARSGLGTLNHTLLSIEALRRRAVPLAGIVMIGPEHAMNRASLARWADAPVIGTVPHAATLDRSWLRSVYNERFLPIGQWSIAHE